MHLGFTGTQGGMLPEQIAKVGDLLAEFFSKHHEVIFHHGDCIGADMQAHALFHDIAVFLHAPSGITIHPPDKREKRAYAEKARGGAYSKISVTVLEELPYLVRNEQIVLQSEALIVAPKDYAEVLRSGTWATWRRARTAGRRIVVVYPDGSSDATED